MIQADKMKAGDLRVEHQQHQEQISKIKWDCEKDIRRLVWTVTANKHHKTRNRFHMYLQHMNNEHVKISASMNLWPWDS